MKKLIRLTEGDLHKIVNESVKRILTEQKFSIDPANLARELFNNGDDFTLFVHWLEKTYSMLQAEEQSQPSSPKMALIQAIKKSRYFNDTSDQGFGYVGDAPLVKPIFGNKKIDEIGYSINQGNIEFYGFSTEIGEWYDDIKINDEQIPQIISLIK